MEKQSDTSEAPYSRWLDIHNRCNHHQCLHSTLAEVDRKKQMILDIIEDNGDTFAKRAEMYYQKRPQLIEMVQDLHKSYTVLADKYHQLRSESLPSSNIVGSLSNSFRQQQQVHNLQETQRRHSTGKLLEASSSSHSGRIILENHPQQSSSEAVDSLNNNSLFHDTKPADSIKNLQKHEKRDKDSNEGSMVLKHKKNESLEMEKRLDELRKEVSKLMEDNLCQQAELIKRNDEKRETIKELRLQIDRLVEENKLLRFSLPGSQKKPRTSKFKFSLFG